MPLARMAIYRKGVELYLAPTADARDTWQATLQHIALEGRCFVLGCNQYVTKAMYPADLEGIEDLADAPDELCRGGSAIISPLGKIAGRAALRRGGHSLRRSGRRVPLPREVRLRRDRPLRPQRLFPFSVNEAPQTSVTEIREAKRVAAPETAMLPLA